jgi:hypothetical protein
MATAFPKDAASPPRKWQVGVRIQSDRHCNSQTNLARLAAIIAVRFNDAVVHVPLRIFSARNLAAALRSAFPVLPTGNASQK